MTLGDAIGEAIERAVERRGGYCVRLKRDFKLGFDVIAAVDGSLEVIVPDRGRRRGLLRRSREALDRLATGALGFRMDDNGIWVLTAPAHSSASAGVAAALERLFTGPLATSLESGVELWSDYTGIVPGHPMPPPHAPHSVHLRASLAVFELGVDVGVVVFAGRPTWLFLQLELVDDGRVEVLVTPRPGQALEIAGFTPSPELPGAVSSVHESDAVPGLAADLLHEHLAVGEGEPLFIELCSAELPDD
jgi:hypothetical protein